MSESIEFAISFALGVIAATFAGIIILGAINTRADTRRDLFLSYCTAHGDTYQTCAKAWEDGEMK